MAENDPKYLVIYHSDHDGEPVALVRTDLPGNMATEIIRAIKATGGRVEIGGSDSPSMARDASVAEMFAQASALVPIPAEAGTEPRDPTDSTADPDALLRAEIRTQLGMEERRKRVEAEVRAEMADEKRADAKAERGK